jgi:hypothetical protein
MGRATRSGEPEVSSRRLALGIGLSLALAAGLALFRVWERRQRCGCGSEASSNGEFLAPGATGPLLLIGDLQRTHPVERIIGREQNHQARARLIAQMVRERPAGIVLLGDLVFDGSSCEDWRFFEALLWPLRRAAIPLLPVLGNHDIWGRERQAWGHLHARFPGMQRGEGRLRRYGAVALILLDSNFDGLAPRQWSTQRKWFVSTLRALDAEDATQGILVLLHHPPYTNSTVTEDDLHVQEGLVPPFLQARKTLAMISGHIHAYERFSRSGKQFIVSGGGGGPRVRLLQGHERRHHDLYSGPSPRPFHYLRLDQEPGRVTLTVKGFYRAVESLAVLEVVELPLR